MTIKLLTIGLLFSGLACESLSAEDGSRLWLRQDSTAQATINCKIQQSAPQYCPK